jgi:ribonuclease D
MAPLVNLCEQARTEGLLALDVEFIRERTYVPKLALIQLAVSDTCALIDPLEVGDLSPLLDLIASPRTLKVLHAAAQDMEVLFWNSDKAPARIFDTQIAAALVGLGEQLSYGHLVASVLGITLPKEETYSDWLQRPLSPAQVTYAVDDVRYLLALHNLLSARLQHMGRVAWAEEEFRKFDAPERYQRHPRALFRRIRRGQTLSSQGLAILRELAEWRDGEAQRRDCPSGSVLRDELLVEIARKAPRTFDDLQRLRGLPAREFERAAAALLQAVAQGLAMAQEDRPQAVRRYRRSQTEELMVKLLDTCLKALCQQHQLAPSCVGTRADLEELVSRYRQGRLATEGSPLLTGWRGALVGQDLLAVLDGRRSVHLEPESGELVLTPRHPGDPSLSDISHT